MLLTQVYGDHQITFYAGCLFDAKKDIDWLSCGFRPRKQPRRASRIEWEHVVSAWELGHQLLCWQNGGRKACKKVAEFRRMESDMHNLRPVVGELNSDRSNFRFGMVSGEPRKYGHQVDFEVNFKQRVTEPSPNVRGDVARTYFYIEKEYGVRIGNKQQRIFKVWNKQGPIDTWEVKRSCRIAATQGNTNPFVSLCK